MGFLNPMRKSSHGFSHKISVGVSKQRRQQLATIFLQSTVGIALMCSCHRPWGAMVGPWRGTAFVPSAPPAARCCVVKGALSQSSFLFKHGERHQAPALSSLTSVSWRGQSHPYSTSSCWSMMGFTGVLGIVNWFILWMQLVTTSTQVVDES